MTLLFGAGVFLFWRLCYPFALAYHEQFQLFLFDKQYFEERIAVPGGGGAYIAEFLVQFYNSVTIGALILALLYVLLQWQVWLLMKRIARKYAKDIEIWYPLSFAPSLLTWFLMGDVNVMLAFPVSLLSVVFAMQFFPHEKIAQFLYVVIATPLLYWLAGPLTLLFSAYVAIIVFCDADSRLTGFGIGVVVMLYAVTCILISALFVPYPVRRLFCGIFYSRLPDLLSYMMCGIACLVLLLPLFTHRIPVPASGKNKLLCFISCVFVIAMTGVAFIPQGYDKKTYELIEYDYLVRLQRWHDIIRKAEKQQPDLPMSVCATNLALGMTDQLGERAFDFFQNGPDGLLPKFERDFNSTMLTAEAYYQLGLVNTAQRYVFESMESIPNYNKSGRAIKRLAETNLINGQYKVAEKYLLMLEKTIFYRKWAQSRIKMIADSGLIDCHPVYGRLRKMRLENDFLFSEAELDKTCGQLLMHNKENSLAMQYLVIYPLLNRDLNGFMNYFGYLNTLARYNPVVCQEALAFASMKKMEVPAGMISDGIMSRFKSFAQTYTFAGKNSPKLEAFRNTLWYYLMKE